MGNEFYTYIETLFGLRLDAQHLALWQLAIRGLFIYGGGIFLFRAQRQFMEITTPFNFMLNFIMGSMLANAIIGNAPYFLTIGLALIILVTNWLVAICSYYSETFEQFIKGDAALLVKDGQIQWKNMRKHLITKDVLMDSVHRHTKSNDLSLVKAAYFENSGRITIILK